MAEKSIDLSENSFLGALIIVASAVGSVVGVAALFVKDPTTLVGIAAGAAWALSLCLFVIGGMQRRRLALLEATLADMKADLADARRQAEHWSVTASTVSQSTLTVLQMVPVAPNPPPRRLRPVAQQAQDHDMGVNR